ncbi:hypothetical protein C8R43DRAFT_1136879 [Mycena crocata]|nr:hypothetical protein C8R43DRAFT_1136879 [Mycena crocata]
MPARIHEIQTHIIFSIHNQTYHPIQPPSKIGLSRICRKERERHEIYGDALLGERLTSFLFHEFPSQSAGFISCIKAAMLSNHTFTNILLKARGHSDMNGFPVDKSVADAFETMAAISYLECGRKKFEVWFRDTFAPLVTEAAAFWNRADTFYRGFSDTDAPESATTTENILPLLVPKKSWVESCILAAASTPDPPATSRFTQVVPMRPSMRRRRLEEVTDGQPPPKRRWTEAMEMAGNQDGLTKSNWVEAMATNNSEPSLLISKKMKQCAKENHRPLPKAEPRRRRTRWDIQAEVPASIVPSLPILHRSTEPPATQIKLFPSAAPTPSSPTQPLETSLERELLEPLWMEPPNPALDGANFTPGYDDEPRSRGGTCSPMEVSPNCSPTRFILPPLEFAGLQHTAVDLAIGSPRQPLINGFVYGCFALFLSSQIDVLTIRLD